MAYGVEMVIIIAIRSYILSSLEFLCLLSRQMGKKKCQKKERMQNKIISLVFPFLIFERAGSAKWCLSHSNVLRTFLIFFYFR